MHTPVLETEWDWNRLRNETRRYSSPESQGGSGGTHRGPVRTTPYGAGLLTGLGCGRP